MTVISLIHATRGRPEKAMAARDEHYLKATHPELLEWCVGVDDDDAWPFPYPDVATSRLVVVPAGWGRNRALNAAAASATGDILFELADDEGCFKGWDEEIRQRMPLDRPAALLIEDGARAWVSKTIINRLRYEQQGFFHCPEYMGLYSDNEFTLRAYKDGVVVEARDLDFPHRHWSRGLAPFDATYAKQSSQAVEDHDRAVFLRRNPGEPFTL